jgi:hypothetical protein
MVIALVVAIMVVYCFERANDYGCVSAAANGTTVTDEGDQHIYAPSGGHRQTAGSEIRPTTLRLHSSNVETSLPF